MSETLSFPGLGLTFEINRVAFTVFNQPIYWYGILFGLAFVAASVYILRRVREFGLDSDRMIDVLLGTIVGGLIGARLYYVIFSWDTYKDNLMKIFNVREGGIAIYGGIIGAVLTALLMCRLRKVKFLPLLDLFAGALLLAQAIGRWGNFVNMEAFGSNTTAPWGMTGPAIVRYLEWNQSSLAAIGVIVDPTQPVHPTFFYESVWCLIGFVVLALYTKRRKFDGEMLLLYLGWYGLGRSFIEGLRTDSLMLGTIRVSQLLAILCVVASVVAIVLIRRKKSLSNDPDYLMLYVDTPEGQSVLAGTFYPKKEKQGDGETPPEKEPEAPEGEDGEKSEEKPKGKNRIQYPR